MNDQAQQEQATGCDGCDGCDIARASALRSGGVVECVCGAVYPEADASDGARVSHIALAPPPSRALAQVLAELELARRVETDERADNRLPIPRAINPIGRMMGTVNGSSSDATAAEVRGLERLILAGTGKVAKRVKHEFVDAFLRHCDETSHPSDLPDGAGASGTEAYDRARARRLAAHLRGLGEIHQRVLRAVARGGVRQGWDDAVARVVDEVLPRPRSQAWRVDRTSSAPPERLRRTIEADAMLRAALEAWGV
jgi:hypothetical protein